jgi:hypothetical protein
MTCNKCGEYVGIVTLICTKCGEDYNEQDG